MATTKSYTDIEQSKKLAEILSLESADGFWSYHDKWCSEGDEWEGYEDYPRAEPYLEYTRKENEWKEDKSDIPCWSLAVLEHLIWNTSVDATSCPHIYKNRIANGYYALYGNYETNICPSMVDACYEMILKLHEKGLL